MSHRLICLISVTLLYLTLSQAANIHRYRRALPLLAGAILKHELADELKDHIKDEIEEHYGDDVKDRLKDKVNDQFIEVKHYGDDVKDRLEDEVNDQVIEVKDKIEEYDRDEIERKLAEEAKSQLLSNLDDDEDAGMMFDDVISILDYLHALESKDLEDKVIEEVLSKVVNITSLSASDLPVLLERTKDMTFDELQQLHDSLCEFQEKKMPGNVVCSANRIEPSSTPSADSLAPQRSAVKAEAQKANPPETTLAPESSVAPVSSSLWTLGMVLFMLAVCK